MEHRPDEELWASVAQPAFVGLEEALQELGIFVGSAVLRQAAERAAVVAEVDSPVLIFGETEPGKELSVRLIHRLSERLERPIVPVNRGAIPRDLVESHLSGQIRGPFTGAISDGRGKSEEVDGSTLFLDEIRELPLDAQVKLLKVLEDGRVEPVGSNRSRKAQISRLAGTECDAALRAPRWAAGEGQVWMTPQITQRTVPA